MAAPAPRHRVIDPETLSGRDAYRLLTDLVTPRPIAWVSSLDPQGRANLAPFSFFQVVGTRPPTVVLGIGTARSPGGGRRPKDTLANILATREFTISHVGRPLAEAANATSGDFPPEISEWDHTQVEGAPLQRAPAHRVGPPRVAAAKASLECRLVHAIPLGGAQGGAATTLVIAEVVCFTLEDGLLRTDESGHFEPIDPAHLAAVGRLGGIAYTETTQTFELPRPAAKPPTAPKASS